MPERYFVATGVPPDLRAHPEFLRLLVEEQNGDIRQMKKVVRDRQDALQHLVKVKGGEHRLACVVQNGNLGHSNGFYCHQSCLAEVPKVTALYGLSPAAGRPDQAIGDQAEKEIDYGAKIELETPVARYDREGRKQGKVHEVPQDNRN